MEREGERNARPADGPPAADAQRVGYQEGYNNSWALVVGVNEYENLPRLNYAVNDAEAVAALLKDEFGFKPERTFLLRDGGAKKYVIDRVIELFINETQPD